VASTGEVGRALLERQHSLALGSQSVIGQVTTNGDPIIALAGQFEGVHRRNEFLPETAVEAAFPLRIAGDIIGALDLQSKDANAFPENDVPIFQSLADNIAIAIDNARLAEQTAQRLVENQQLFEQMRTTMQQVERLNQQLTTQAWTEYLGRKRGEFAFTLDLNEHKAQPGSEWTPALLEAVQQNELVRKQERDQTTVAVPLRVRGQVIGAMEFELENGVFRMEDIDLVETVSERLGLALESARLYDESRRVAHREAMLNQIGGRLQSSNNVDGVLSEAAHSLQSTLGAQRVAIRLGTPTATNAGQQRNGS
jgi:GAF domain-containing protein